jgi:hypothetical protein
VLAAFGGDAHAGPAPDGVLGLLHVAEEHREVDLPGHVGLGELHAALVDGGH